MQISKEILEKLRILPINRECTHGEIAEFCGVSSMTISRVLSTGKCKPTLYSKLLNFLETKAAEIEKRKQKEQELLNTPIA